MDENQTLSVKQNTPQKRHESIILHIKDIHNSKYVKQEGWEPNFIETSFGEEVYRVNVVAIVVEPPLSIEGMTQFSCTVDDGTSKIELRAFEEIKIDGNLEVGTPVLIIGKPREYNNVYYILPEIIRPIEKGWVEYRKKELEVLDAAREGKTSPHPHKEAFVEPKKENQIANFGGDSESFDDVDENLDSTNEQATPMLLEVIEKMDTGDGVSVADLNEKFDNAEEKITRLLLHGEVYEIKPGRIKVLK